MSYFDQYSPIAGNIAEQYGLDRNIFFGLIDTESSWNPFAQAKTSSAYGFTQLTRGTAAGLGVNPYDPTANLQGGASYLRQQLDRFGNYPDALAAYYGGPGNIGIGRGYANTVISKSKKYGTGLLAEGAKVLNSKGADLVKQGINLALNANPITAPFAAIGDAFGLNPFAPTSPLQDFLNWIRKGLSSFLVRVTLAILAFIILFVALYMMKDNAIERITKNVR